MRVPGELVAEALPISPAHEGAVPSCGQEGYRGDDYDVEDRIADRANRSKTFEDPIRVHGSVPPFPKLG